MNGRLALVSTIVASLTLVAQANDWPQFRGRDASGVAVGASAPPVSWGLEPARSIGWRIAIPGLAHSSPIVWATVSISRQR